MHRKIRANNVLIKRLTCLLIIFLLTGCEKNSTETAPRTYSAGEIISSQLLQVYSTSQIINILNNYQVPDTFNITYSVECISITYQTTDLQGNDIRASGALDIPQSADSLPILSIQHGTETKRDRVASVFPLNSIEGVTGLLMASMGYASSIADYPGFGISTTLHPYVHAQSLTKSVIDFLKASKSYCKNNNISLNDQLFLGGYSEGGYVTLALQKEIEDNYSQEYNITAVAPMAGPYDLKGTLDSLLQKTEYQWPAYIAFFFYAYDKIYKWNKISEIFNAPYSSMLPSLFDGSKSFADINNQLPTRINSLLNQNFINNYFSGNEQAVSSAIEENTLLNWTPIAPIRFFHGDADDVVPYQNAITTMNNLVAYGASDISLITFENKNHETAGMPSVLGMIEWFDTYRNYTQLVFPKHPSTMGRYDRQQ